MDTPKTIRPIPEVPIGIVLLMLPETLERAMSRRQHVVVHLLVIAAATALAVPFVLFRSTVAQQKATQAPDDDQAVYVGLVEDDRRQLAQLGSKDVGLVSNRTVTPAFARDASGWKPVDHLIRTVRWTIAFDGKNLGELDSEPISEPQAHPNSLKGPLYIHSIDTPLDKIPAAGKPTSDFAGNFGTDVRRPLVVVSKPNFSDPEHWKRAILAQERTARIRTAFRETFGHIRHCDSSGEILQHDATIADSDLGVLKTYGSNDGSFIVETQLKDHRCVFNKEERDLQLLEGNQWFYVNASGTVLFLGRDWQLVDAGDYDGDGKSEVIFYVAEGEDDCCVETVGYILFYDGFRKSVRFTWKETEQPISSSSKDSGVMLAAVSRDTYILGAGDLGKKTAKGTAFVEPLARITASGEWQSLPCSAGADGNHQNANACEKFEREYLSKSHTYVVVSTHERGATISAAPATLNEC